MTPILKDFQSCVDQGGKDRGIHDYVVPVIQCPGSPCSIGQCNHSAQVTGFATVHIGHSTDMEASGNPKGIIFTHVCNNNAAGTGGAAPMVRSRGPAMLVIEDDDDIRESLSEMLGACGYSALAVPSAHQALVLLRKGFRPRVIVLDPFTANDVEGFHVSLGSNPAWATIPVIAGPNTRAAERMAYSGPQHILGKALDPRELLTFLGRYCIATSVRF